MAKISAICLTVDGVRQQSTTHDFAYGLDLISGLVETLTCLVRDIIIGTSDKRIRRIEIADGMSLLISEIMEQPHVVGWVLMQTPVDMNSALKSLDNYVLTYIGQHSSLQGIEKEALDEIRFKEIEEEPDLCDSGPQSSVPKTHKGSLSLSH
jgi:hypothetical protein